MYSRLLIVIALSLLSGCAVKQQWLHTDKNTDAYYRDDAQCLKLSNKVLFEQLQEIPPQKIAESGSAISKDKSFCILPDAGKRIHQLCMEELGWELK